MIDRLKRLCSQQRGDLSDHLAGGGAADYAEYCKAVGAIQALSLILVEIDEMEKMAVEE